jgi:hypothetical protein
MRGGQRSPVAAPARPRPVHRGFVEVVADPSDHRAVAVHTSQLRENLADVACRLLFAGACLAQVADAITTVIGLGRHGRFEANFLMREAVTAPAMAGLLKLTVVALVCAVAMLRLPVHRARVGLLLALSLGAIAPIQNVFQILGPR